MSEVEQDDSVALDGGEDIPQEQPVSDVTPDEAPKEEKRVIEFDEAQQEHVNSLVGKKAAQRAEAERKRIEAEQKLEAAQAEIDRLKQPSRPEVPEMPDEYDPDFVAKIQAREQALQARVRYDTAQELKEQQDNAAKQAVLAEKQAEIQRTVQGYVEKAGKLGIDHVTVANESALLAQYIQDESLLAHVLTDEHGPLVGSYIVNNPLEAEMLAKSTPLQAAAYIESTIKPKAIASRKKIEKEPGPLENPDGVGLGEPNEDEKWGTYS